MGNNNHALTHEVRANGIQMTADDIEGVESLRLHIAAADNAELRQILEEYLSSWLQQTGAVLS